MEYLSTEHATEMRILSEEDKIFEVFFEEIECTTSTGEIAVISPRLCIMIADPESSIDDPKFIGNVTITGSDTGVLMEEVVVLKEFRNKGFGTKICQTAIHHRGANELYCYKENPAFHLYVRLGFRVVGYLDDKQEIYIMMR